MLIKIVILAARSRCDDLPINKIKIQKLVNQSIKKITKIQHWGDVHHEVLQSLPKNKNKNSAITVNEQKEKKLYDVSIKETSLISHLLNPSHDLVQWFQSHSHTPSLHALFHVAFSRYTHPCNSSLINKVDKSKAITIEQIVRSVLRNKWGRKNLRLPQLHRSCSDIIKKSSNFSCYLIRYRHHLILEMKESIIIVIIV